MLIKKIITGLVIEPLQKAMRFATVKKVKRTSSDFLSGNNFKH